MEEATEKETQRREDPAIPGTRRNGIILCACGAYASGWCREGEIKTEVDEGRVREEEEEERDRGKDRESSSENKRGETKREKEKERTTRLPLSTGQCRHKSGIPGTQYIARGWRRSGYKL